MYLPPHFSGGRRSMWHVVALMMMLLAFSEEGDAGAQHSQSFIEVLAHASHNNASLFSPVLHGAIISIRRTY